MFSHLNIKLNIYLFTINLTGLKNETKNLFAQKISQIHDNKFHNLLTRKRRSQWICEAIEAFLQLPESDVCELTGIADEMDKLNKKINLKLSNELAQKIDNALIDVRKKYPDLEGVKGKIIRASIIQRLIGRFN